MKPTTATTRVTTDARMKVRGTVRPPAIREVCHASLDDGYRCRMPEEPSAVPESSVVVRPEPIDSADYGASTGHNSLLPISAALPVLRNRTRPEHSILVVHTDVPDNNFTVMFETLAEDHDTYLSKDAATFASAVGRSFYNQIIPSN